uniref:Secreted protein n=1 Tax=Oryza glumipatula TaxID=40148 RepID=A0A0D9YG50_9ORYZ
MRRKVLLVSLLNCLYPALPSYHIQVNCSFSLHMVHPKLPEYMLCGMSYFLRARVDDIAICMTVPFGYMPRMASVCTPSLRSNTICLEGLHYSR